MPNGNILKVEVTYAASSLFYQQSVISLEINIGANIKQAIIKSNILLTYPEIDLNSNLVGIFGEIKQLSTPISNGDRIEIYRKLIQHPNNIRKQRANLPFNV